MAYLLSGFEDPVLTQSFVSNLCLSDCCPRIHPSFVSETTGQHRQEHTARSAVFIGSFWLESLSDLSYLSLITQRALLTALVLSWVGECVRYAGDVGWCKYSTDRGGACCVCVCVLGGKRWVSWAAVGVKRVERE